MGERIYTLLVCGVVLFTVNITSIVIFLIRQYRRYATVCKEYIRKTKKTLARFWTCARVNIGVRASPILILGGVALLLLLRHENSSDIVFSLIGSSLLITFLWILFDCRINYKEIDIAFDLHDHIETLDRTNASEIIEGLNNVKFVESYVPGEPADTSRMRAMINEIAKVALIPSIYHDHHCREIMSYDDPMQYIRTKRDIVVDAFNLGHHEDYMQLVLNRLPASVTVEEAVESYISTLFVDVIGPSLIRCCETKIAYYELVVQDWSMSRSIRGKAKYFKEKNEQYIFNVREKCNVSTIIGSAIKSRER
jgi:hypothetical protein